MTTEDKLLKLRKLADAMYYAAQYLTTDASRLHKAMDEYHQFIIHEYHKEEPVSEDTPFKPIGIPADAVELANIPNKKEPTIPDIVDEHWWEMLGEEPVSNKMGGINNALSQDILAMKSVDEAMAEVEEKAKAFTEAHKGESSEQLLAEMRGEDSVSEDLETEMESFFIKMQVQENENIFEDTFKNIARHFAKWQKQQMMAKAFDFTKEHNIACVLASECLRNHGWFSRECVFNDLFRHLSCVDKLFEGKFSGKTKVIVIKED
jgi:hypothetical protein